MTRDTARIMNDAQSMTREAVRITIDEPGIIVDAVDIVTDRQRCMRDSRPIIDRLRRRQSRAVEMPLDNVPSDVTSATTDWAEVSDEVTFIRQQMEKLKPDEKQVLSLALEHDLPQAAIAERLRMPLGTVKSHARRGLIRLRELMGVAPRTEKVLEGRA